MKGKLCIISLLSMALGLPLFAQQNGATVTGHVYDPSGAPVAGARITAKWMATGAVSTAESDPTGLYQLSFLNPGQYEFTVEKQGFRQFVQGGVTLLVAQKAVMDFKLLLGSVTQSVNVTANAPLLQAESGEQSWTIDSQRLTAIPIRNLNTIESTWFAPGVTLTGSVTKLRPFDTSGSQQEDINGGMSGQGGQKGQEGQATTSGNLVLVDSTHPQYLAQNITYTPWGAEQTLENGCAGSGCVNTVETYAYNNRLQPVMIELGTTANAAADYCLVYNDYASLGSPGSCAVPSQGTGDNGNVRGYLYQDSVNSSLGHTASYSYDSLNRLTNAAATGSSTYNFTFQYDRWGNMTCMINAQTNGPCPEYSFNSANNQITNTGYTYDAAGNLTSDLTTVPASAYQWDAEGRLVTVLQSGSTYYTATYDASGHQVETNWPPFQNLAEEQLRDPSGRELSAYDSTHSQWYQRDIRLAGRVIAQSYPSDTYFLHANALGSDTQITDYAGAVPNDWIYYPWGNWTHTGIAVDAHFAGFEEGDASNFPTPPRTYSGGLGRWLTPDLLGGDITNPQSLNRYAYALNNPTTLTDPSGLDSQSCSDPEYFISHAECGGTPGCVAEGSEGCIPYPVGYPVGGGGGGGGTVTTGGGTSGTAALGNGFIHNPLPCLTPAQQRLLQNFLLGTAAALLHLSRSQVQLAKVNPISVQGGALNVNIEIPTGGLAVSPDVIANAGRSNPIFEPHDPFEIRNDEIVPVGPGTSVHVVFAQGVNAEGQPIITSGGQPVISNARVHADIGNPDSGAGGVLRHVLLDFAAASVFSTVQGGIPGCPVKFQ